MFFARHTRSWRLLEVSRSAARFCQSRARHARSVLSPENHDFAAMSNERTGSALFDPGRQRSGSVSESRARLNYVNNPALSGFEFRSFEIGEPGYTAAGHHRGCGAAEVVRANVRNREAIEHTAAMSRTTNAAKDGRPRSRMPRCSPRAGSSPLTSSGAPGAEACSLRLCDRQEPDECVGHDPIAFPVTVLTSIIVRKRHMIEAPNAVCPLGLCGAARAASTAAPAGRSRG